MITPITSRKYPKSHISFKAGIVDLSSDFDGTYMPVQYNHDVICRDIGTLNKKQFQSHFDEFEKTAGTIKGNGSESKFKFTVTTGRNLHEFNYFMQRLKDKSLSIMLPDSLVTNNGGDEFFNTGEDFFKGNKKAAFLPQDVNKQKEAAIKQETNGWDGDRIKDIIKQLFGKENIREVQTTNLYYAKGMSLQDSLEANPVNHFVALKENDNLRTHLSFSKDFKDKLDDTTRRISQKLDETGMSYFIRKCNKDTMSIGKNGEKLPSIDILPKMQDGNRLTKEYDLQKKVKHIQDNKTNDLVIVAGDGSNDFRMLNLFNFTDAKEDFSDVASIKKMYDVPVISIFVNNGKTSNNKLIESLSIPAEKADDYFNSDGNIRFICVDKNNPKKPQSLSEAIVVATKEYAKRNPVFKENLSDEMKAKIDKLNYEYPINQGIIQNIEQKANASLANAKDNIGQSSKKVTKTFSNGQKFALVGALLGGFALFDYIVYKKMQKSKKNKSVNLANKANREMVIYQNA